MPRDQRLRTELVARALSDFDDPMFRLQFRMQLEAMPQWVEWARMRGDASNRRAYGSSVWHRLVTPVERHVAEGTSSQRKTLCGRTVPGSVRHIATQPLGTSTGPAAVCRTCVRLQRPGLS